MQQLVNAIQPTQDPKLTADAVRKTVYSSQLKDKVEAHVTAEMARLGSLSDQGAKAQGLENIVEILRALNEIKDTASQVPTAQTPAVSAKTTPTLQSAINTLSDPTKTETELVQACAKLKGSRNEAGEMALLESLSDSKFQAVRNAAAEALVGFISGKVLENLVSKLGTGEEATVLAATALRGNPDPRAVRSVFQVLQDTKSMKIAAALQGVTLPDVVTKLTSWLSRDSGDILHRASIALKGNSDPVILNKVIADVLPYHHYCDVAAEQLKAATLSHKLAKRIISDGLSSQDIKVRKASVLALSHAPRSAIEPALRWCVLNDHPEVRQMAATLLGSNSYEQLSIQIASDPSLAIKMPKERLWVKFMDSFALFINRIF